MSSERPYEERPAARPVEPLVPEVETNADTQAGLSAASTSAQITPKKGVSGFVWALVIIGAILFIIIAATSNKGSSTSSSGGSQSTDPIYQVQVVLDGKYSYDQIKSITDSVIAAYGLPATDDSANRIWSAVLSVTKGSSVPPMDVMTCAVQPDSGMTFPDMAGICFTILQG